MDIMSFARIMSGNRKRNSIMTTMAITAMTTIISIYHMFDKKK